MSQKIITIIARNIKIIDSMIKDLKLVFGETILYNYITYSMLEDNIEIKGDLILVSHHNETEKIKHHLKKDIKILIFQRTFWEEDIKILLKLPKGTKALVVNDSVMNTIQSTNSLNNLNLSNVTFIPYLKDKEIDESISVAITPDEEKYVPDWINKVINIGNRHLDIITFLDIIHYLKIYDDKILDNLLNYCSRTINDFMGIKSQYRKTTIENLQLKYLLKNINQGILVIDSKNTIILSNDYIQKLINLYIEDGKTKMEEIFDKNIFELLKNMNKSIESVTLDTREIIVKHEKEDYYGEERDVFYFNDVTYLHLLENTIKEKVINKGYIANKSFEDIIYKSEKMKECIEKLKIFAKSDKTILIEGQSGTGKEILAQSIHNYSIRKIYPFIAINCAALPESLLESELFGYEKGAFTGASHNGKLGLFEQANNGTIFLDEIGDMPLSLQAKLLRVLQEKQVMRLGSSKVISINVRIIAATNQDLKTKISEGKFREDLYYRLNVLPSKIPILSDRKEDILPIFYHFTKLKKVSNDIEKKLLNYSWPGNVRELQNVAEYYLIMKDTAHPLPEFMNFLNSEDVIKEKVLKIISLSEGIGREKLYEKLSGEISEYKLRKIIEKLKKEGKIKVLKGRKGIVLN
ncbi:sigma-54 interaction domain-containing protein [Fusobacterium perfoetens]|uniref:sigma-54 interaction domain-containing protein n=1 Tax=Fusobacterium perfoetens TaxID=852 RepID=UPI0006854761|nr:sigma 54-interacting transcriptional regulator [Fusobacterium perfoetens]